MTRQTITLDIAAPPEAVWPALVDPGAVARWRTPDDMTATIHHFDAREGGTFRISLTYLAPDASGKTAAQTDTYHGWFLSLVPGRSLTEEIAFETDDPALQGRMTLTTGLTRSAKGTLVAMTFDNLPPGIDPALNEAGTRQSLEKLARLVGPANNPRTIL